MIFKTSIPFPLDFFKITNTAITGLLRIYADPLDVEPKESLEEGKKTDFKDHIDCYCGVDCDVCINGSISFHFLPCWYKICDIIIDYTLSCFDKLDEESEIDTEEESIDTESNEFQEKDMNYDNDFVVASLNPDGSFATKITCICRDSGYFTLKVKLYCKDFAGNRWNIITKSEEETVVLRAQLDS